MDQLDGGRHEVVFESFQSPREISAYHHLLAVTSPPLRILDFGFPRICISMLRTTWGALRESMLSTSCGFGAETKSIVRIGPGSTAAGIRWSSSRSNRRARCLVIIGSTSFCSGPISQLLIRLFERVNSSQDVFEFNRLGSSLQDRFCCSYLGGRWRSRVEHDLH